METGGAAGSEAWSLFLRYAARARAKPTFDAEERDHRLALAASVRQLLEGARVSEGADWAFDVTVLDPAGPPYFLVPPPARDWLSGWVSAGATSLREALAGFVEEDLSPQARFTSFAEAVARAGGQGAVEAQPNIVLALGSFFNFALAPTELPIMRQQDFTFARRIRGEVPDGSSAVEGSYQDNLELARAVHAEMDAAGIPVRDMLDVQSLIVVCSQERDVWMWESAESRGERTGGDRRGHRRPREVYLSLSACLGYDAPYLLEWIEFHRLAGIERFLLYNNGDRAARRSSTIGRSSRR